MSFLASYRFSPRSYCPAGRSPSTNMTLVTLLMCFMTVVTYSPVLCGAALTAAQGRECTQASIVRGGSLVSEDTDRIYTAVACTADPCEDDDEFRKCYTVDIVGSSGDVMHTTRIESCSLVCASCAAYDEDSTAFSFGSAYCDASICPSNAERRTECGGSGGGGGGGDVDEAGSDEGSVSAALRSAKQDVGQAAAVAMMLLAIVIASVIL